MVAHSGAVVARGVTVMMGAEIAALAALHLPARGENVLNFEGQESFRNLRRGGGGSEAGSYLMRTAVTALREPSALRFWATLGLQRGLLKLLFVDLGQQAGHLGAACRSGSTS